jgi:glucan phosphoethanolaminetransferase (alkaline phosphatase superfamily)
MTAQAVEHRRRNDMNTIKKQARVAGLLYLLASILGLFGLIYVPSLIVPGDATATGNHVRASETLLRLGIASELIGFIMFIFVVLALYGLFKRVSEKYALAMAILLLISIPISLFNVINEIAALFLVSGANFQSVFNKDQLDALAYLFLRLHGQGFIVAGIFWGLWLFPFGILVIRSGFIPRLLGVLLFIAGCSWLASSFAALMMPSYRHTVDQFANVLTAGELPIIFWLLIWGAKDQRQQERPADPILT